MIGCCQIRRIGHHAYPGFKHDRNVVTDFQAKPIYNPSFKPRLDLIKSEPSATYLKVLVAPHWKLGHLPAGCDWNEPFTPNTLPVRA